MASLIEQYRDDVVVELARSSAAPWTVGWTFVAVCPDEDRIASVVMPHVSDSDHALRNFAVSALGHLRAKLGWPALERIVERARVADPAPQHIANIYLAAPPIRDTWERLERETSEVQAAYWKSFGGILGLGENKREDVEYALQHLVDVRRPVPVVQCLAHTTGPVDTNLIIQTLELLPTELIEANARGDRPDIHGYDIAKLFEKLDVAEDVTRQTVARLEVPFVSVLSHDRPHLALHHEVMEDAATFADLIGWAFKSSDAPDEQEAQDQQRRIARAQLAWDILFHIRRVPGQNQDGSVNAEHLAHWVSEARRLCEERGRADIGDQMIGQVLANAPEGADGIWPCEPVRGIFETSTQRRHLGIGFRIGKVNLRGVTTRGIFEGGPQERALAAKFRADADAVSVRSPFTARLLRSLAERYERLGQDEDFEADWRDLGE